MNKLQLIYDLEVYPNFFLAKFYDTVEKDFLTYYLDDDLLTDIIQNPDIELIGFNNHYYDDLILNFIDQHSTYVDSGWGSQFNKKITEHQVYDFSSLIINSTDNILLNQIIKNAKYHEHAYSSLDLKSLLDPMPSLKKLELRMNYHNVQDLPFDPTKNLTDEEKKEVEIYCENDVSATYQLYSDHSIEHIKLRKFLAHKFRLPESKLTSASEPKTAEFILSHHAAAKINKTPWQIKNDLPSIHIVNVKNCIPDWIKFENVENEQFLSSLHNITLNINPVTGYLTGTPLKGQQIRIANKWYQIGIGGLHSIDSPQIVDTQDFNRHIIDADVTSYYPSMLLRDNLYPRGYNIEWNKLYRQIYEDRLKAKAKGQDLESNALKIILNATFGKLGSQYSSFYDPELMLRITLGGQLGLLMLIEALANRGIEILSANTDGIVTYPTSGQLDIFYQVCKEWEEKTLLNLEYNEYLRFAQRDVNNYAALTINNKVKTKGIFTPPDIKHDVKAPIVQKMVQRSVLYNQTPEETLEELKDELTIYDFLYSHSATKSFNIYTINNIEIVNQPDKGIKLNKTNRWYIAKDSNIRIFKYGGKNNNSINIPDGNHIQLMNKITDTNLPNNLFIEYYGDKAYDLINTISKQIGLYK